MSRKPLGFSIVIPTHGRTRLVARLLDSLAVARKEFAGPVEILIVDDSLRPEADRIREVCSAHLDVAYLQGDSSVRKKRNLGIARARQSLVLFVDSDCEATPRLLAEHARSYDDADPRLGGVVGATEFVGRDTLMWRVIQSTQFLNAFSFAKRMDYAPWATCSNVSYRTAVLRELGGFDVAFPFRLGGDDVDLGLRLNAAGYRLKANPRAVVLHTRETWDRFWVVCAKAFRWGRMDLHVYYRKHPDRLVPSLPRFGTVFLLVVLVSLIHASLASRAVFAVVPFAWAAAVLLLQALITVRRSGRAVSHIAYELLADCLGLAFEFGTLFEGIRRLDFAPFHKVVRRGPVLPVFEQQEWVVQHWSMTLGLLLVLLIAPWLR